jgi:hypothetical protein
MITPKMIPDGVVEAAAMDLHGLWKGCSEPDRILYRAAARAAILAALNAWPGAELEMQLFKNCRMCLTLPLPLTQDKP